MHISSGLFPSASCFDNFEYVQIYFTVQLYTELHPSKLIGFKEFTKM